MNGSQRRLAIYALGATLMLTACQSGSSTPNTSGVKEGGNLIVALSADMVAADPALASDQISLYVADQVIQGLVGLKPGTISDVVPVLAAAMPVESSDGLTYTFKLRTGIKFSDGTPFNADAVKYNYTRQQNLPKPLQDSYDFYYGNVFGGWGSDSNISSIDTPDEQTVVFHFKNPQSNFLISQTLVTFGIQSPTALQAGDADNPDPSKSKYYTAQGTGMIGTGPFMLKQWVPNDHVTLVRNPNYWDPATKAHLDSVTFRPITDLTAALNALQSGDVDMSELISPSVVKIVKADSSLQLIARGQPCNTLDLGFNLTHAPVNNKNIRLAIAYAVNKPAYAQAFFNGLADVSDNWMPLSVQDAIPLKLPTYNPTMAKQLIAQSGLSGSQLTLDFYYASDFVRAYLPDPQGLYEAISRDLTAVGFTVVPHADSVKTGFFTTINSGQAASFLHGWGCDWAGPDNFIQAWLGGGKTTAEYAYSNPQVADAVSKALSATDPNQVKQYWDQAQTLLAADMPTVPLLHAAPSGAAKTYVMGFVGTGNLEEFYNTVWLNK